MYGSEANSTFALKCLMKNSPFYLVSILLLMTIFVFGHALRICERYHTVKDQGFGYYWNSMWMIILTMTTGFFYIFFLVKFLMKIIIKLKKNLKFSWLWRLLPDNDFRQIYFVYCVYLGYLPALFNGYYYHKFANFE